MVNNEFWLGDTLLSTPCTILASARDPSEARHSTHKSTDYATPTVVWAPKFPPLPPWS